MEYLTCNKRKDILTHVYIYDIKKSVYYDCINNAIITTCSQSKNDEQKQWKSNIH